MRTHTHFVFAVVLPACAGSAPAGHDGAIRSSTDGSAPEVDGSMAAPLVDMAGTASSGANADGGSGSTSSTTYADVLEDFSGSGFFSHFFFGSGSAQGVQNFVDQGTATSQGLAYVDAQGHAFTKVDSTNTFSSTGRSAVALFSTSTFTNGIFIVDVVHMPEGKGTWPAYWHWNINAAWPAGGEIDVIEGGNDQVYNQTTLHTLSGCDMAGTNQAAMMNSSSNILTTNCNGGCSIAAPQNANSFATGFNQAGGGVYAERWSTTDISVWFWTRDQVPANITSGAAPDPSQWGTPIAYFPLGANCPSDYFYGHNLIIYTQLCGDLGNYPGCSTDVQNNPAQFVNAYWEFNYIHAYALP